MHFIPVSVHKSFQSSSSTASTVVVDVDVDVDEDVDIDVEDEEGTIASPDLRSSTRTGTFCRSPSIGRDKSLLRFSSSHN